MAFDLQIVAHLVLFVVAMAAMYVSFVKDSY